MTTTDAAGTRAFIETLDLTGFERQCVELFLFEAVVGPSEAIRTTLREAVAARRIAETSERKALKTELPRLRRENSAMRWMLAQQLDDVDATIAWAEGEQALHAKQAKWEQDNPVEARERAVVRQREDEALERTHEERRRRDRREHSATVRRNRVRRAELERIPGNIRDESGGLEELPGGAGVSPLARMLWATMSDVAATQGSLAAAEMPLQLRHELEDAGCLRTERLAGASWYFLLAGPKPRS